MTKGRESVGGESETEIRAPQRKPSVSRARFARIGVIGVQVVVLTEKCGTKRDLEPSPAEASALNGRVQTQKVYARAEDQSLKK